MLTRLELILKVDRPEHPIAKQEAPLVSSQLFRLGLGSPNVAAASIVDAQQYRFSTHCRRLEAYAFSGSLGGHVSAAGLKAGSRDRIQPDNPATIERDWLVAYLYGITSERRLVEEVRMHLAYRWFTRLAFEQELPSTRRFPKIVTVDFGIGYYGPKPDSRDIAYGCSMLTFPH